MSLDISNNNIGALVLPDGWESQEHEGTMLYFQTTDVGEDGNVAAQKEHPGKPEGAIALADAISANGAMTNLNVSKNNLGNKGSEAIAEALRENNVIKNLDISKNYAGATCAQTLADGVIANGALQNLNIGQNSIPQEIIDKIQANFLTHQGSVRKLEDNKWGGRSWSRGRLMLYTNQISYAKQGKPQDQTLLFSGKNIRVDQKPAYAKKTGTFIHGGVSQWRFAIVAKDKEGAQETLIFAVDTEEQYKMWVTKINAQLDTFSET